MGGILEEGGAGSARCGGGGARLKGERGRGLGSVGEEPLGRSHGGAVPWGCVERAGPGAPVSGGGRMNEAEGLRQRRPFRPQVITEDSPAQEAKEGRWGLGAVPLDGEGREA